METSSKSSVELGILNEAEVIALGEKFSQCLLQLSTIILSGEIGSGKTTFVRGVVKGLGCDPLIVTSPTFTVMNIYNCKKTVFHVDAYRLNSMEEIFYIMEGELEDIDGIFLIEWGDMFEGFFGDNTLILRFQHVDNEHRKLTLVGPCELVNSFKNCIEGRKTKS
ncbi:MAG: tRNA (adenosine(37)-N6)-threonylcarbamoyltransferase complex ATPase subunit type 1 TsaE [Fervidobacterium sp.]